MTREARILVPQHGNNSAVEIIMQDKTLGRGSFVSPIFNKGVPSTDS